MVTGQSDPIILTVTSDFPLLINHIKKYALLVNEILNYKEHIDMYLESIQDGFVLFFSTIEGIKQ